MTVALALPTNRWLELAPDDEIIRALTGVRVQLPSIQSVGEAKSRLDAAATIHKLLERRDASRDVQNSAALLAIVAERRCGELLPLERPGRPRKLLQDETVSADQRASRKSISRIDKCRWRKLTRVTVEQLEDMERECTDHGREFTRAHVQRQLRSMFGGDKERQSWETDLAARKDHDECDKAFNRLSDWLAQLRPGCKGEDSPENTVGIILRDRSSGRPYLSAHDHARLTALARDVVNHILKPLITGAA